MDGALFVLAFLVSVVGTVALYYVIDSETTDPPVMGREEAESIAREEAERRARRMGRRREEER